MYRLEKELSWQGCRGYRTKLFKKNSERDGSMDIEGNCKEVVREQVSRESFPSGLVRFG